jgi:hypothetical protein
VCAVDADTPPTYYSLTNTDCDDDDNSVWRTATVYTDADGDGYTVGTSYSICYGAALPAGVAETQSGTDDCDDEKVLYADGDGDGFGSSIKVACDGVTNNDDCNDALAAINPNTVWYLDEDNDGYYTGDGVTQCASPGANYKYTGLTGGGDCEDESASVNPGVTLAFTTCPSDINVGTTTDGKLVTYMLAYTNNCSGTTPTLLAGYASGATFPIGTTTVSYELGEDGPTCSFDVTVKVDGNTSVTVAPTSQQYSDKVTLTATISPVFASAPAGGTVTFKIGTQTVATGVPVNESGVAEITDVALLEPTPFGTAPTGQMASGERTVTAEFIGVSSDYVLVPASPTTSLTITRENADLNYSGAEFFSTSSNTSNSATIAISATVTDKDDAARGDIQNAKVDISGNLTQANLNVGLVNPSDATEGVATWTNIPVSLSNTEMGYGGKIIEVKMKASGNYYTSDEVSQIIAISVPGNDFVTGGGNLVLDGTSAGEFAGTSGSKMNFGFTMKNNKSGRNLQGQVNVHFRRWETVDGVEGWYTYKIKSNAINSLAVRSITDFRQGIISTKANLSRTYPDGTVESLGGNLDLTIEAFEATSGNGHKIAVTLRRESKSGTGGVVFSSSWSEGSYVARTINGGNIRVSGSSAAARESFEIEPVLLQMNVDVVASPNPVADQLQVVISEAGSQPSVRVQLFGADQRLQGTYNVPVVEGRAQQTIDVKHMPEGLYILTVDGQHGRISRKVLKMN